MFEPATADCDAQTREQRTMPDLKTIGATLFTLTVVAGAVRWSLDDSNQVAVALRTSHVDPHGARFERPRSSRPRADAERPNEVRLAVDPDLPELSADFRTARRSGALPDWTLEQGGYSGEECTRSEAELLEGGRARFQLALGDWCYGEHFRFEISNGAAPATEVALTASWWSDLVMIDAEAGKPWRELDYSLGGVVGRLTLSTTAFTPGARVPFHFAADCAVNDKRWEARGVFEFP